MKVTPNHNGKPHPTTFVSSEAHYSFALRHMVTLNTCQVPFPALGLRRRTGRMWPPAPGRGHVSQPHTAQSPHQKHLCHQPPNGTPCQHPASQPPHTQLHIITTRAVRVPSLLSPNKSSMRHHALSFCDSTISHTMKMHTGQLPSPICSTFRLWTKLPPILCLGFPDH